MAQEFRLDNTIAVITGSSSGIGRAVAVAFAEYGADVIVHGRTASNALQESALLVDARAQEVLPLHADLADRQAFESFVEACWNWKGRVDCWINNAGADVLQGSAADSPFLDKLAMLLDVDVTATVALTRLVAERMKAQHGGNARPGCIINMGWDQAWQGMAGESGQLFGTAKGAIMAATLSLAQTYGPHVRVNCIAPGCIRTEWGEHASPYWQDRARRDSLLNRWGLANDVAGAAVFLASRAGEFINGQIIRVNGGFRYDQAPPHDHL